MNSIDNQPHDSFFKQAMSHFKVATEFFEAHLPKHMFDACDMSTLKIEKDTFIDETLGKGLVDILYSVKYNNNQAYFYILVEHQTKQDKRMPLRILKYILQIIELHLKKHPTCKLLPLVHPLLLYTGGGEYKAPLELNKLFIEPSSVAQMLMGPISLVNVSERSDDEILRSHYSGMMEYIMKRIHTKDICFALKYVQELLQIIGHNNVDYIKEIMCYILNKAESERKEEVANIFRLAVREENRSEIMTIADRLREEGMQQGIEVGRNQGIEQGICNVAKNMLAKNYSINIILEATGLTQMQIDELKEGKTKN